MKPVTWLWRRHDAAKNPEGHVNETMPVQRIPQPFNSQRGDVDELTQEQTLDLVIPEGRYLNMHAPLAIELVVSSATDAMLHERCTSSAEALFDWCSRIKPASEVLEESVHWRWIRLD